MALPNEIHVSRFNRLLAQLCQIKGGSPAPVLTPEILAVLGLEMDRPEWKFLAGEMMWVGRRTDAAVAGQRSHVGVRNPAASAALIVIDRWWTEIGTSAFAGVRANDTIDDQDVATVIDTRFAKPSTLPLTAGPVLIVTRTQIGGAVAQWNVPALAQMTLVQQFPIVLSPGFEFLVVPDADNTAITVDFHGTVRQLEQSEL